MQTEDFQLVPAYPFGKIREFRTFAAVKKLTVILFLSVHLTAFAEFHQLLRIPFMVQHFQKHRTTEPTMSFGRFLEIHYLGPYIAGDDFMQDQKLPFRSVDSFTLHINICNHQPVQVDVEPPVEIIPSFSDYYLLHKAQGKSIDIFQPPRCA